MSGRRAQEWGWFDLATVARWGAERCLTAVLAVAAVALLGFGQVTAAGLVLLAAAVWAQHRYTRRLVARLERDRAPV